MNFYDTFIELCTKIDVKPSAVALELGISKSNISNWKRRGTCPTDVNLKKIADYFGVSTDYLLGRTDKPDIESDKIKIAAANDGNSEIKILSDKLLILDLEDRTTVNGLIDTLLSKEKYNKKPDQNVG